MKLLDAIRDERLFADPFGGATWRAWRTVLAALFAEAPHDSDLERYRQATGRRHWPVKPFSEAWLVVGRRGGKSAAAALVAVYLACFRDYRRYLAAGEHGTLMVIAADRRQARTVLRYINGLLDSVPMLSKLVSKRMAESVEFSNRINIEVHTASFRAVRGYTLIGAILDEVAFWHDDATANPDTEIVAALRPGLVTIPGALLLGISSPYARRGVLWEQYKAHFGRDDSRVLVWQASTRAMNPTVSGHVVDDALAEDEPRARAEYLAEFRRDIEAFLPRETVDAVTVPGRRELLPLDEGVRYLGFVDPSGGSADSFTLAIAHEEMRGDVRWAVLDLIREVRPPFSPSTVVADFAAELRRYRVSEVSGDRYSAEWCAEQFRKAGIHYRPAEKPKSDLYRELLGPLNSGTVELLDHPKLAAQLVGLERRVARGGRESIDHAPSAHDDVANAAAGALHLVLGASRRQGWTDLYGPRPELGIAEPLGEPIPLDSTLPHGIVN
jgi:hypothetical protein